MRIHSNVITPEIVRQALADAQESGEIAVTVDVDWAEEKGSRKRDRAVEFSIGSCTGDRFCSERTAQTIRGLVVGCWGREESDVERAVRRSGRRYSRNTDRASRDLPRSATWHEWGALIERLFAVDPSAIIGRYDGLDDFEDRTGYNGIPPLIADRPDLYGDLFNGRIMYI